MKVMEWLFIIIMVLGVLAFFHALYLYFWVYGDVVHAHLTPKEWLKMYGINIGIMLIASVLVEIIKERSR